MAKKRLVVGDQSSAEIDQIRETLNNLLKILENAGASITATCTAEEVFLAIAAAVTTGVDNNAGTVGSADYVSSNLELVGVEPMNKHPLRPGFKRGDQLKTY